MTAERALRERAESRRALACAQRALDLSLAAGDGGREARARFAVAEGLLDSGKYAEAREENARARAIFAGRGERLETARADAQAGRIASIGGRDPSEARKAYEAALQVFEDLGATPERLSVLVSLSLLQSERREALIQTLEVVIADARAAGLPRIEARALHSLADKEFALGRYDEAVRDLLAAIALFENQGDLDSLADAYVSLGRIHRAHGQPAKAVEYYDRAGEIQERTGDIRGLIQSTNAKAVALERLGRPVEAGVAYQRALELAKQTGAQRLIDFQQGNLATWYGNQGDHVNAVRLLEDVLQRAEDPYILAYRHGALAYEYHQIGQTSRAIEHADRAVEYARQSDNREYLVKVLSGRAEYRVAAGALEDALADARAALDLLEEIRGRLVPLDFMKRGFSESNQRVYGLAIRVMASLGRHEEALVTSEHARARAFLDLLASRDLVTRGPLPAALTATVGKREISLVSYAAASTASIGEMVTTARRLRATILSYWVDADGLLAWIASPQGDVHGARVAVPQSALEQTIAAAVPTARGVDRGALSRLHGWLIAPVGAWLPRGGGALAIVPHGPLFRLSFATLLDPRGRYLIEQYALSYAPSVSVFPFTERILRSVPQERSYLLVANPEPLPGSPEGPLPPLPASMREITAIRAAVRSASVVVLARRSATEPAVREALPGRTVIHLATHGILLDSDDPFGSFLALGVAGTEASNDGRLTARELYDVNLTATLVVLSACRSAAGTLSGDGIVGMTRALFYAGASSVLATVWDVADEPSARLMSNFYTQWRGGLDKRSALRAAQLHMIRALRDGRMTVSSSAGAIRLSEQPFYWAGYVLMGEP